MFELILLNKMVFGRDNLIDSIVDLIFIYFLYVCILCVIDFSIRMFLFILVYGILIIVIFL